MKLCYSLGLFASFLCTQSTSMQSCLLPQCDQWGCRSWKHIGTWRMSLAPIARPQSQSGPDSEIFLEHLFSAAQGEMWPSIGCEEFQELMTHFEVLYLPLKGLWSKKGLSQVSMSYGELSHIIPSSRHTGARDSLTVSFLSVLFSKPFVIFWNALSLYCLLYKVTFFPSP